ncbi:MAG: hydrogenase formation protein HypD [Candidatus Omnitrophota bacterium]
MRMDKKIRLMEVCGTHTMAIARSGIKKLLPKEIELISGPGCPVCVTAQEDIDRAVGIAGIKNVIITSFGDMIRVPGTSMSLEDARLGGADVRMVYSCMDALDIAERNPSKKVVFIGVGFETTAPTIAATVLEAKKRGVKNFFVLSDFKAVFPALEVIASSDKVKVDGFICPGHVSVITGSAPYKNIAGRYKMPCVITGFEDDDILKGIKALIEQIKKGKSEVEIAYKRAVTKNGNIKAKNVLNKVFEIKDAQWRGIGIIKKSGLKLKKTYAEFDAKKHFKIKIRKSVSPKGCICGEVLQGIKNPSLCGLFGKKCTPRNPIGPCMVSSEGTCAAWYRYGG